MKILQVSTTDSIGGAATVAASLHAEFRRRGLQSWIAAGTKRGSDPDIFAIPNDARRSSWARAWNGAAAFTGRTFSRVRGASRLAQLLRDVGSPRSAVARFAGRENFDFPGTWTIPGLPPESPDILHLHNLHGEYFDLRALPWLTSRVPTAITLHDAWLLSGHCAHSFDCGRWEIGCGSCPDLSIPPAIARDGTAGNWERKREIYARSRLYLVSPSAWLLRKAERSILSQAAVDKVVIPNGVDTSVFRPGSRIAARQRLGLPQDAAIVLFAANGIRENRWKDYYTLRAAVEILGRRTDSPKVLFVGLGESGDEESVGTATIRFEPFRGDRTEVADFYRAADIYMHAARADTFPNTIIEALACGTPVAATGVGGIPEQIHSLADARFSAANQSGISTATGIVTEPGDGQALAAAAEILLDDDAMRLQLGQNAAHDAAARFSLTKQVDDYMALYDRMLAGERSPAARPVKPGFEDIA